MPASTVLSGQDDDGASRMIAAPSTEAPDWSDRP